MLDEAGEDQQGLLAQRLAEADVVLQEPQDNGVEQQLTFGGRQALELVEGIVTLQKFILAYRAQFTRVFVGQQHDGRGQRYEQIKREQDVLLARRTAQHGDVPVRFQVPHCRHQLGIREVPVLVEGLQLVTQVGWADQHAFAVGLFFK